jgi:hypothetical protein
MFDWTAEEKNEHRSRVDTARNTLHARRRKREKEKGRKATGTHLNWTRGDWCLSFALNRETRRRHWHLDNVRMAGHKWTRENALDEGRSYACSTTVQQEYDCALVNIETERKRLVEPIIQRIPFVSALSTSLQSRPSLSRCLSSARSFADNWATVYVASLLTVRYFYSCID